MVTLFHDYTSPSSAVAVARLLRLSSRASGHPQVDFEGYEAFGVDLRLPAGADLEAAARDVAEDARAEGVTLRIPDDLPPTGLGHVVGDLATDALLVPEWLTVAYRAFWHDAADLADPAVLTRLAAGAGLDDRLVSAALADRSRLLTVRRRTAARRREGIGGVPTILAHRTLVPGLLPDADLIALVW